MRSKGERRWRFKEGAKREMENRKVKREDRMKRRKDNIR